MKTQGEIEAAVCKGMSHFEQEYMGRGPKDIRAHLNGDLLVVRLRGVLTAAEQHLVTTLPAENLRIKDRGSLQPGYFADLAIFDPATIQDHATFEEPHQYAGGVRYLLVNGQFAIRDEEATGVLAGVPLRRTSWTED